MFKFICIHPAKFLTIYSHQDIVEPIDGDFVRVTKQLHCTLCNSKVNVSCTVIANMDKFLGKGKYNNF